MNLEYCKLFKQESFYNEENSYHTTDLFQN